MPLRQRIHSFLTRYATHLRVASFLAALAIILYLLNPFHTLLLTIQTAAHYLITHAISATLITVAFALFLASIPYAQLKAAIPNQFGRSTQKYKKLNPSVRFWLFLTPFILISVGLLYSVPPTYVHQMGITDPKEALTHIETERKDLGALILSIFGAYGLFLTWRRTQTTEQGHITDRYSKAIEQLGAMKENEKGKVPNIEVRLGAIYALERIAWDSPRDHWTIMEVLTAYIRQNAPAPKEAVEPDPNRKPPTEIQAILDVLKRRNHKMERQDQTLKLDATDLRGATLRNIHLPRASFASACLQYAKLQKADLEGAYLRNAHLEGANLLDADLEGANLLDADLEGANLTYAHLEGANLRNADLEGANLTYAHLEGANLRNADLEGAYLRNADLEGAYLGSADLERADLADAHLERAHLFNAHLAGANLRNADLEGANLNKTLLQGAIGITVPQIQSAYRWQDARYDPEFRRQLGLPDDPEPTPPTQEPT